jgi:hypothetical protein
MSSIVRPSMSAAKRFTSQARASGPSTASITTATMSHAKTTRSSGTSSRSSATAKKRGYDAAGGQQVHGVSARPDQHCGSHVRSTISLACARSFGSSSGFGCSCSARGFVAQCQIHGEMIAADVVQAAQVDQPEVV